MEGRALLENFRRRQRLKLLPGLRETAGTVSVERLEALLGHQAFGYNSDWKGVESVSVDVSRREALETQLQELEVARAEETSKEQEVQQAALALQQEMTAMVDHHGVLSRQLAELRARKQELGHETLRLQAILADLAEGPTRPPEEPKASRGKTETAKVAEKLQLHRAHLQRLQGEQKQLQLQLS